MRASVVVNNYNYGRFLREALDSALAQTHSDSEVIVVDDGSTDDSVEIIEGYGTSIIPVIQENGGQASAVNAGLAASSGRFVVFLDSDDVLMPTALEAAAPFFDDPDVAKVHWRQIVTDPSGEPTDRLSPKKPAPTGELWDLVLRGGPDQFAWPALSGNAWARDYLDQVFPVPLLYRRGIDNYLFQLAPYFGRIEEVSEPQSLYRSHEGQISHTITFDEKLKRQIAYYEDYSRRAADRCRAKGTAADLGAWRDHSWWCRLEQATHELEAVLPPATTFALIDDDTWGLRRLGDRRVRPLTENNGAYWGPPKDVAAAIEGVEQLLATSVSFLVIAWPAFWWLDHYEGFDEYLHGRLTCVLDNERLVVFQAGARDG